MSVFNQLRSDAEDRHPERHAKSGDSEESLSAGSVNQKRSDVGADDLDDSDKNRRRFRGQKVRPAALENGSHVEEQSESSAELFQGDKHHANNNRFPCRLSHCGGEKIE